MKKGPASNNPYTETLAKIMGLSSAAWEQYYKAYCNGNTDYLNTDIVNTLSNIMVKSSLHPEKLCQKNLETLSQYNKIWQNALDRFNGKKIAPLYKPEKKDRRFADESWDKNLLFDFIKQSYILTAHSLQGFIEELNDIDEKTKEKNTFYIKQYTNALSPSNFYLTNPEAIKETFETNGQNIINGLKNLLDDIKASTHTFSVNTTNKDAFTLGKNIATSKGRVIYQNTLMQLIQYQPTQTKNYQRPILLIPAWINKYYILDLSESNSLVKWLLNKGYTVFIISWVNPNKKLANTKFEDYMKYGPLAALDEIEKATGHKDITALGYCLGGTLLACTLAYLKAKSDTRIKAATFLTTLIDYADAGDISVFIDDHQLDKLEEHMIKNGYLDGTEMSAIFNAIRSNDLIWSFVTQNYLLGKTPFPFDILYWNSDSTRIPATAHSFYLRNMYGKNLLIKPNGITLLDTPIDISKIDIPLYFLSTSEDHIAPWEATLKTLSKIDSNKKQFVLAGSGHVAGVVNPPHKHKYNFYTNATPKESPSEWKKTATSHKGSWWSHWELWNQKRSGQKISAPKPKKGIEAAPGSYVKLRS